MTPDEQAALKSAYPAHAFMLIRKDGWQAILAIPRKQPAPEREAAAELYHGATVKLSAE